MIQAMRRPAPLMCIQRMIQAFTRIRVIIPITILIRALVCIFRGHFIMAGTAILIMAMGITAAVIMGVLFPTLTVPSPRTLIAHSPRTLIAHSPRTFLRLILLALAPHSRIALALAPHSPRTAIVVSQATAGPWCALNFRDTLVQDIQRLIHLSL